MRVRVLHIGEGQVSAAIIKYSAKKLVIALVKTQEPRLQIVALEISGKARLASGVSRAAIFRGGIREYLSANWSSRRCCSGRRAKPSAVDLNRMCEPT